MKDFAESLEVIEISATALCKRDVTVSKSEKIFEYLDYVTQGWFNGLKIHTNINHKHYIKNNLQCIVNNVPNPI